MNNDIDSEMTNLQLHLDELQVEPVAIGKTKVPLQLDGEDAIAVMVSSDDDARKVPRSWHGFKVVTRVVGPIRIRENC